MAKAVIAVFALVVGVALGAVGFLVTFGVDAGLGLAAGLSAGMCETLKAAQDLNLLTDAQAGQVFDRAAQNMQAAADADITSIVGGIGDCDNALSQLQGGTAS